MKNLLSPIFEETQEILARYVYKRFDCGCRGAVSLAGDYRENEVAECEVFCSTVTMAWDGGVVRKVGVSSLPS